MKNLKKALLSTAVLAGLASGNVFAGTEACFEVYKTTDVANTIEGFADVYGGSSCVADASRLGASTTDLEKTVSGKIAYELTKSLALDLGAIKGTDNLHIVYIPTTDIPGGTKITMTIAGANFHGNANQIHLVKHGVGLDGAVGGGDDIITAVASSDGVLDGTNTVTFITKAGTTIGAGTRLVLSKVSTGADTAAIPVGVKFTNSGCTDATSSSKVTIKAVSAVTDGGTGYSILGAVSKDQTVIDTSAQFLTFVGSSTVLGQVNAESLDKDGGDVVARTEFVYDTALDAGLVLKRTQQIHKAGFANRAAELDRAITVDGDDSFEFSVVQSADAGESVMFGAYDSRANLDGSLANQIDLNGSATGSFLAMATTKPASAQVSYDADDLFTLTQNADNGETTRKGDLVTAGTFTAATVYNELFFTVTQTDTDEIMNFNYDVNVFATLNFSDAAELDHCERDVKSHSIGVNGAVLKVPYTVAGEGNFVRVTNEHTTSAEVTVDLFSETADGTVGKRAVTAVKLGDVAAKSSTVYYVKDIVAAAQAQKAYAGSDGNTVNGANVRHTMTFTVTSPKNTVHGVSVQKLSTGQDRVMPVLDLNDWQQ